MLDKVCEGTIPKEKWNTHTVVKGVEKKAKKQCKSCRFKWLPGTK